MGCATLSRQPSVILLTNEFICPPEHGSNISADTQKRSLPELTNLITGQTDHCPVSIWLTVTSHYHGRAQ